MATHTVKADWFTIDPATLASRPNELYMQYKACYKAMKAAREMFEQSMQAGMLEGERVICGYNFGKLSVAIVPDERKPAKASATLSLTDFLAQRSAEGRRI